MASQQSATVVNTPGPSPRKGPGPEVMSARSLAGDPVVNLTGESVGDIKDLMIDMRTGKVSYAVLSFGSILGMGAKLFAVPWAALTIDGPKKRFVLNVTKERLKEAPGFDKENWPNMADLSWEAAIHRHYGTRV